MRRPEGPFGEFMGFYVPVADNHVFEVSAVVVRPDAIFHSLVCGSPEDLRLLELAVATRTYQALMAASLLCSEPLVLCNLPHLADITSMANLLNQHGVEMSLAEDQGQIANGGHCLKLDGSRIILRKNVDDAISRARGRFKLDGFESVDDAMRAIRGRAPGDPLDV